MVAVFQEQDLAGARQGHVFQLCLTAEGVTLALRNEEGAAGLLQRLKAPDIGLALRVERIADADNALHTARQRSAGCQHGGNAPAHGFAANEERAFHFSHQRLHGLLIGTDQKLCLRRRSLLGRSAAGCHIGKLEPHHGNAFGRKGCGQPVHDGGVHRRTGAMGQKQGCIRRAFRAGPEKFGHQAVLLWRRMGSARKE